MLSISPLESNFFDINIYQVLSVLLLFEALSWMGGLQIICTIFFLASANFEMCSNMQCNSWNVPQKEIQNKAKLNLFTDPV